MLLIIFKPGMCQPVTGAHLIFEISFVHALVCVCSCVCLPPRALITSGMIWCDTDYM